MKKLSIRTKLYYLQAQYWIFDRLSNITRANKYFVQKKIAIGAAIISLSLTLSLCTSPSDKENKKDEKEVKVSSTCYMVISKDKASEAKKDTMKQQKKARPIISFPKIEEPVASCYLIIDDPVIHIETDTLNFAEQMPEFPGGIDSLQSFLACNIKHPDQRADEGIFARVIIQFIITNKGEVVNPKVLRSLHPSLDQEAIRVIKLMPKWIPGKQNGKEVNVRYTLPVLFEYGY